MKTAAATRPYDFVLADIFTETVFGGNPLAVLPDARGLPDERMQIIAREFNLSETVFVLPPDDPRHDFHLRIFTPRTELPFAGHPTVGAAAVLAHLGKIDVTTGQAAAIFEEGVGPVGIQVRRDAGILRSELMLAPVLQSLGAPPSHDILAALLSLPPDSVRKCWLASIGVPFCFMQLADNATVDRARLHMETWHSHFANGPAPHLFFFAGEPGDGRALYARMMAPAMGIEEDPATGAACAALAASLGAQPIFSDGTSSFIVTQGVAMGRPSRIEASFDKQDGRVTRIRLGGASVIFATGTLHVPAERDGEIEQQERHFAV
ncbi:MAG TPA: PhzF family phenazine biosynthesis protein [Dongiaceae bacterium]|nr:PhzF family phenazine biosynthesis protein [Dongiaceae bacterium]